MTDPPHDVPDRGPDIVVTVPRPDPSVVLEMILIKSLEMTHRRTVKEKRPVRRKYPWD
jgi:hypothetical protein